MLLGIFSCDGSPAQLSALLEQATRHAPLCVTLWLTLARLQPTVEAAAGDAGAAAAEGCCCCCWPIKSDSTVVAGGAAVASGAATNVDGCVPGVRVLLCPNGCCDCWMFFSFQQPAQLKGRLVPAAQCCDRKK